MFFALGAFPGCGGDDPEEIDLGECPPDSTAQQMEGAQALEQTCVLCHSTTKTGDARLDAPEGVNLDDPNYVSSEAGEIYEEVSEGAMPPGGKLPDATIESIRVYLACGAP